MTAAAGERAEHGADADAGQQRAPFSRARRRPRQERRRDDVERGVGEHVDRRILDEEQREPPRLPDGPHAFGQFAPDRAWLHRQRRLPPLRDQRQAGGADDVACRIEGDPPSRTDRRHHDAAQGGSDHHRDGIPHREQPVHPAELLRRDDLGEEAAARRLEERVADADEGRRRNHRQEAAMPVDQAPGQDRLGGGAEQIGADHDASSGPAVPGDTTEQEQDDGGNALCRQNDTQTICAVPCIQDGEAHRDGDERGSGIGGSRPRQVDETFAW